MGLLTESSKSGGHPGPKLMGQGFKILAEQTHGSHAQHAIPPIQTSAQAWVAVCEVLVARPSRQFAGYGRK